MTDDDLIRRGDALAAVHDTDSRELAQHGESRIADRIAALPPAKQDDLASGKAVTVRVKWRNIETAPRGGEWFIARTEHGTTRVVRYADEYDRFPISHDGVVWPTAPTEWTPLKPVLAALEPVTAPDPVALLRDVPRYEPDNPLDNAPSMKADPQGDWLREADVLAALSRAIILKGADHV